jgi:hypothetical protein
LALSDAGELLAGQVTRILRRQSPISAEHQSPRPPLDVPILDEKGLNPGRLHPHSEASELAIPGEHIPTLVRLQRIDRSAQIYGQGSPVVFLHGGLANSDA